MVVVCWGELAFMTPGLHGILAHPLEVHVTGHYGAEFAKRTRHELHQMSLREGRQTPEEILLERIVADHSHCRRGGVHQGHATIDQAGD